MSTQCPHGQLARQCLLCEQAAEIERLRTALEKYADVMNWGYYDHSGSVKGLGAYTEACLLGPQAAEKALRGGGERYEQ